MKISNPELKVVRFSAEDVIATSGFLSGVWLSGFGDGNASNNAFHVEGTTYYATHENDENLASLKSNLMATSGRQLVNSNDSWVPQQGGYQVTDTLWYLTADGSDYNRFNGSYSWNDSWNYWQHNDRQ